VWLQGCSIRCEGCISPENQPFDKAYSMSIDEAAERISSYTCDGVTISGGEPFDQAEELLSLLTHIDQIPDILVYTGYAKDKILREHSSITQHIAALVDGEFRLGLPAEAVWKGSENQTLTVFRQEFAAKYESWAAGRKGKLQLVGTCADIRLIGIPRQEDLPELFARLAHISGKERGEK
jgi:anaerobic ribonucleoside-triphosphate reductase activating protein